MNAATLNSKELKRHTFQVRVIHLFIYSSPVINKSNKANLTELGHF
jgi:hypothetical protein